VRAWRRETPRERCDRDLYPLPGEVEFAYVIRGELELTFSDEVVKIGTGDAITFDPALHRSFRVPGGAVPAEVLWLICPALPQKAFRA
jgi:mannose-6-phosphate isomerase-like protein (cupin superfamily)